MNNLNDPQHNLNLCHRYIYLYLAKSFYNHDRRKSSYNRDWVFFLCV